MVIKKTYLLLVALMLCTLFAHAQDIQVSAPSHVAVGENFRLSYTVNTQNVDEFRAGNVPAGLEVIAGPYTSKQSSYQFINGHTSSSSIITYTYTLYAEKAGTYTIPSARVHVGGKSIASRAVRITVSGSSRRGSGAPQMHEDDVPEASPSSGRMTAGDLFVKVSANKRRVHEQEPVLLTYKVYTLVDLTSLDGKMPDLTGFHTQEVPLPQQKSFHLEKLNGKNYRCVTWSQYVMFPQMTGKLSIPSITFKGIVVQQNRSVDPFEAFFNGGSGYVEVKRNIVAPGLDIQVDPLPAKPSGFSGGVGKFSISAQLLKSSVKEGDPLTLRVVVGGIGNLKLVKQPVVEFPKNFEKYDPKVTDKTKLTSNGIEGNMVFDYLVVPRNRGEYTIPAVSLVYYDTSSESYKTIKTQPLTVKVEKGDGKRSSVDDYSDNTQATDIKPINAGDAEYVDTSNVFFGSFGYWAAVVVALAVFAAIVAAFRRRAIANADVVRAKGKRANKVAAKRLKAAYKLMLGGKQGEFYDEVLRALWGYVGDRMNMPVENLSREMIADTLASRGIMQDTIDKFINALDECEFERYAPGDAAGNMNKTYDSAMVAIMDIENSLKTSKKKNAALTVALLVVLAMQLLAPVSASAITKANADSEYSKGNYQQAAADYQELLKNGESPVLYYNLGNSYYRLGNITQSIIAYEKALRLDPSDADVRYNLEFVRSKTIDKIVPANEMFFVSWYWSLVNTCSVDGWAHMAVASLVFGLLMALLFLLGSKVWMRKVGFYAALLLAVVFVLSNVFAWQQRLAFERCDKAVVTAPTVNVKSTPSDTGTDAFVIHEGTSVTVTDRTMKEWFSITLANGKEGWLKRSQVEVIQ